VLLQTVLHINLSEFIALTMSAVGREG